MKAFSVALATAMREQRITNAELARRVGCGRVSIGEYLSGEAVPRRERLQKINEVLGTKLTITKNITAQEVAAAMGTSPDFLRKAMRKGQFREIGEAVQINGGRFRCLFYPMRVKELVGID
jgi:predicted transcriptional regulator